MGQCKNCGNELDNNSKFCANCGAQNDEYVESAPTSSNNKTSKISKKGKIGIIAGIIAAVVIIAIIIVVAIVSNIDSSDSKSSSVNFKKIYNQLDNSYYVKLASDNSYLEIDTNPLDLDDYFSYDAWVLIQDANKALGLPESLEQKMGQTRALDGRQVQTYGKITVTWSYHPDKGLVVLYEKAK